VVVCDRTKSKRPGAVLPLMKLHRNLALGLSLVLVLCIRVIAQTAPEWENWVENYYLNPEADKVVPAVYALSRSGYFEQAGQPAMAIGFLGAVFARNPDRLEGWMQAFRDLPAAHHRLVVAALWYSGSQEGAARLRELARHSDAAMRAEIENLTSGWKQPSLAATPVLSRSSLELQWGAFLGSGDPQHVRNVLAALGSQERGVSAAARVALAQKAQAHTRVFEICQTEIARQPERIREELNTALLGRAP
jgi:hypothetical protein